MQFSRQLENTDIAHYLLFTDGLNTLGDEVPKEIEAPIYIFSSGEIVNFSLLKMIARKSGGEFNHLAKNDNSKVAPKSLRMKLLKFL